MRRWLSLGVVGSAVFALVLAAAASLSVGSGTVSSGNQAVGSCDANGVSVSYTTAWDAGTEEYMVTTATVTGLDLDSDACASKDLKVTVTDSGGASLGEGTVTLPVDPDGGGPNDNESQVVNITPDAQADTVTNVYVLLG